MMSLKKSLFWGLIIPLQILLLWPLLRDSTPLYRDDKLLVTPLYAVDSVQSLVNYWRSPSTPDLQPVRDTSYLLDIAVERAIGYKSFHLQNLLLWLAILGCLSALLKVMLHGEGGQSTAALSLIAVHPAFFMSVGWISARKHLLATLFVLLATLMIARERDKREWRSLALAALFYALSVLSQPITIFWPLFAAALLYPLLRQRQTQLYFLALALLMTVFFVGNYYEYHDNYAAAGNLKRIGELKFSSIRDPIDAALAWGRMWLQMLFPFRLATQYAPQSSWNLLGLALGGLISAAATFYLWDRKRMVLLGWLAITLPLLLVLLKIQDLFWSDTYLLLPGIAIASGAAWLWREAKVSQKTAWLLLPLLVAYIFESARVARRWQSDLALWSHSQSIEPTCGGSMNEAVALVRADRYEEAPRAARFFFDHQCSMEGLNKPFLYLMLYWDEGIPLDERLKLFQSFEASSHLKRLLQALIEHQNGETEKSAANLVELFKERPGLLADFEDVELKAVDSFLARHCQGTQKNMLSCLLLVEKRAATP